MTAAPAIAPAPGSRGGFFGLIVARPVALTVLFLTLLVVGVIGYRRIPMQLLPSDLSDPSIFIWIANPGASAQQNEEHIARIIEEQIRTLTGIEELQSTSSESEVMVRITFDGTVDMDLAKAEVRDRLERARPQMPATAENAFLWSESAADLPISFFGIILQGDPEERDYLVEKVIQPRLDAVQGIGKVTIWGVLEDSVRILLDEEKVAAAQLDLGQLIRRLAVDNFALPMGDLDDGGNEILLRSDMRFHSLEEIAAFPIGGGLEIADVGEVARVKTVGDSLSRIDGGYAYYGMATKDSQSNVVETSDNLRLAFAALEADPALAGRMRAIPFFLQGELIEDALAQLRTTAEQGGLLAVAILFVFLRRVRLTLCVALCIPVSALLAILWEYAAGGSFNVLTMTGITLGIGMLVDNAVVVVENIAREHREGRSAHDAAVVGSRQIALAITLATLTTVVVFLPLIFMTDNRLVRVIFGGIGIPLSTSLLASLLLAVVFLPVVTARLLGERARPVAAFARRATPVLRVPVVATAGLVAGIRCGWYWILRGLFAGNRLLLRVLSPRRGILVAAALALLFYRLALLAAAPAPAESLREFGLGGLLPPAVAQGMQAGSLALFALLVGALALLGLRRWRARPALPPARPASFVPPGDSLVGMVVAGNHALVEWTLRHRLAASGIALLSFLSILVPWNLMVVTPFGQDPHQDSVRFSVDFNDDFTMEEAALQVAVYEEFLESKRAEYGYAHWSDRFDEQDAQLTMYFDRLPEEKRIQELEAALKKDLPRIPGHTLRFYDREPTNERSLTIATFTLHGPEVAELEALGREAIALLREVPGLAHVTSELERAPEQIRVEVDRERASKLAVSTQAIQQTISYILAGYPLPRYQEKGRDVPLLIEYDEEEVAGLPTLRDMSVFSATGMVPLSSVANLSFTKGAERIRRVNGKITFTIWAEVEDPLRILPITLAGYAALAQLDLPRGCTIGTEDSALARQEEETSELKNAFGLAVALVFLLMAILFESLLLPFSVLFTIPFAIVGAAWILLLTGTPMDSMGWIGMIILAGVVVNNGIVLIDRIHGLRGEGLARAEAVVLGCAQRVRPVLMTALTTVGGLVPMMVTEPPPNGFDYRAVATIVAGGLAAATFFTLWVVPLVYTLLDDLRHIARDRVRWWTGRAFSLAASRGRLRGAPVELGGVDGAAPWR
ncbi:MAG: efflux RND transporter permease subunit [Planctomycetota bacterium]